MFKQIINSAEPNIIGVKNGISQVEIDEKNLERLDNFNLLEDLFLLPKQRTISEYNQKVKELKVSSLKAKLLKKAKLTDIMGFSPYFFGCKYLVSERFLQCLELANVDQDEYRIFSVEIDGIQDKYYLFWTPYIDIEEINFSETKIYPSDQMLAPNKDFFEVNSYEEYKDLRKRFIMINFEEVSLPDKYSSKSILNIQGLGDMFFSDKLIALIKGKKITSFDLVKNQVILSFNNFMPS